MGEASSRPRGLRRTFRALGTPNYRLFFIGQVVSVTGTWMQRVAQDWLILELGGGPVQLSIGIALQSAPFLILGVWGGLIVDRFNARRLLLATQVMLCLLALIVGILVLTGNISIPVVYASAVAVGFVGLLDMPARQTFVLDMVGPAEAANAVSLNSSVNNSARLIGPAVAGVIITVAGVGIAYLVNAASFLAIIYALTRMDPSRLNARLPVRRGRGQVRAALGYAWNTEAIRVPLIATLIISAFAQNFRITLPIMTSEVFGGQASRYGWLMSALGAGALVGALVCAHIARPSLRMIGIHCTILGVALVLSALAPTYLVLLVLTIGVGAGNTSFNTTSNAMVLINASTPMRGRVTSLRSLVSQGITPLGSLLIGWVCAVAGARIGVAVGGVVSLLTAAFMLPLRGAAEREAWPSEQVPEDPVTEET